MQEQFRPGRADIRILFNAYDKTFLGPMPDVLAAVRGIAARLEGFLPNREKPLMDLLLSTQLIPDVDLRLSDLDRVLDAESSIFDFATRHGDFQAPDLDAKHSFLLLLAAAKDPESADYWIEFFNDDPKALTFRDMTAQYFADLSYHKNGPYYEKRDLPTYPLPSLSTIIEHAASDRMFAMRQAFDVIEPIFDVKGTLSFKYEKPNGPTYQLVCRPQMDLRELALDDLKYNSGIVKKMQTASLRKTGGHVLQYEFGPDHPTDPGKPVFYLITDPYLEMAHGADRKAYIEADIMYNTTRIVGAKVAGQRRTLKTLQELGSI